MLRMAVKMRRIGCMFAVFMQVQRKKSPVTVELSYDADGDLNVVEVPKYDLCGGYAVLEKL